MGKLQNKVAIVTGASKGIGAGIAKGRGAAGAPELQRRVPGWGSRPVVLQSSAPCSHR
jgi:hypothetical protein